MFATCGSRDAVVIVEGKGPDAAFARQEYHGFAGFVLKADARRNGFVNVVRLTVKQTSATTATATISDYVATEGSSVHEVELRKVEGKWVVVNFRLLMIS